MCLHASLCVGERRGWTNGCSVLMRWKELLDMQEIQGISPYTAPEVKLEKRVSCSADIYSFGVVLWYSPSFCLTWRKSTCVFLVGVSETSPLHTHVSVLSRDNRRRIRRPTGFPCLQRQCPRNVVNVNVNAAAFNSPALENFTTLPVKKTAKGRRRRYAHACFGLDMARCFVC